MTNPASRRQAPVSTASHSVAGGAATSPSSTIPIVISSVKAEHQELVDELSDQYSHIESNVSAFAAMVHIGGFVPLEARKAPWKHRMAPLWPNVVSSPEEREQAFILEWEATDPLVLIASTFGIFPA